MELGEANSMKLLDFWCEALLPKDGERSEVKRETREMADHKREVDQLEGAVNDKRNVSETYTACASAESEDERHEEGAGR